MQDRSCIAGSRVNPGKAFNPLHPPETTAFKISTKIAGNFHSNCYPVPNKSKTGISAEFAPAMACKPLWQRNLQITPDGRGI
jgi:hypothetical protein